MIIPKVRTNEELKPLNKLIQEVGPFKNLEDTKKGV